MNQFYTTKVKLEVEIEHGTTPEQAINFVKTLVNVAAVNMVRVLSAESNYVLHQPPNAVFKQVNVQRLQ